MTPLDCRQMFEDMHPGFFQREYIASLPPESVFAEMVLDLPGFSPDQKKIPVPEGISFGFYRGSHEKLLEAVASVVASWQPYYRKDARVFCAMNQDQIASFCIVEPMGAWRGLRIGGPGCVGTVPAYRRQGIGLKMVQQVTGILKAEGYDISYIHFTGVASWYSKLGYQTILTWNSRGILSASPLP